jgi:hypothetical protein
MRFATFPTINSIRSIAAEFRLQFRHVVVVPMENRTSMSRRDCASELLHLNAVCDQSKGGTTRTPRAEGRQSQISKTVL